MIKTCSMCGILFETKYRNLTCSELCRKMANRLKAQKWNDNNPDKVKEMQRKTSNLRRQSGKSLDYQRERRATKHGYIDRFLERARSVNKDTDLDREYLYSLMECDRCNVSSVPFRYNPTGTTSWENPYSPSIDRINSDIGYYKGNIQIVLTTINLAKNKMTMDVFIEVWKDILSCWKALTQGKSK